jgi:phosphate:Na+ symporter
MIEIIPFLIGGLALFLFAIFQLSQALDDIFTDKAKVLIGKFTKNIFYSILTGLFLTIIFNSSSAVIILTIVFINARTLNFRQSIGIIMGSNIGTTFSSQIIAFNIAKYSIIPLLIGLMIYFFAKKDTSKKLGRVLLFLGMLFFGLYIIEQSVYPLKDSLLFEEWMKNLDNNKYRGTMVGGLITLIIRSSSATVGLVILLSNQKLINISGGIAIMLGAELGTCSDTLLATIRGRRQAIKAGIFHFLFNLSTIFIGLMLFEPFVEFIKYISATRDIGRQIANAHMAFNISGVLIFLPFIGLAERMLNYLIPDKEKELETIT